jgi:hypothetical protein
MINGMTFPHKLPALSPASSRFGLGVVERLCQVSNNVVDVLDAYAQAKHFRRNANLCLFFG